MQRAENANPSMLAWARQAVGLSEEQAARSVGLSASGRSTAVEKLVAIESGATHPTRNQLLRFADAYRRPPTVFYLTSPLASGRRGEDFRTTSGPPSSPQEAALLDALLRDVRVRQSMVKAALEDDRGRASTGPRRPAVARRQRTGCRRHASPRARCLGRRMAPWRQ